MIFKSRTFKAVTLLEVVLAIFIFLLVLVLSLGFWSTCARFIGQSRVRLLANHVAAQTMEKAREAGFDEVDAMQGAGSYLFKVKLRGKESKFVIGYDVNVVEISETLKSVQVKVGWGEKQGVTLETFLYPSS